MAVIVSFVIAAIAVAIMQNGECGRSPVEFGIHKHLTNWMGSGGHYVWQSRGYYLFLGLCALFVLCAPKLQEPLKEQFYSRKGYVVVSILALLAIVIKFFQNAAGMIFGLVCLPVLLLLLRKSRRLPRTACAALLALFVAVLVVPGLFAVPDLTSVTAGKLLEIQLHYSDVVGPGALLAAGRPLFRQIDPFYGVIEPVVVVLVTKFTGPFSFGTYVELVRLFQATFIVLAACLFYRLSGRSKIASLFAIAFFAPLMQLNQMTEYFPNQTAWRLMGFPVAVLVLTFCRSMITLPVAYGLGALATGLIMFNFETGLCMTAGFLAFFYMRDPHSGMSKLPHLAKLLVGFVCGMLSSFVCLYLAGWLVLGYAPDLVALWNLTPAKQLMVKSGYLGGGRLEFQPIPFLMVVHCLYTIVRISLDTAFPASFRNGLRVSIATMCLLWFLYFVNRPGPGDQYLIGCYFLYSLLLLDLVRAAVIGVHKRKSAALEPALVTCAVLALLIVPRITQQLKNVTTTLKTTVSELAHGPAQPPASLISGVYMPKALGNELERKSAFVKTASSSAPVYYLTASSFVIPCLSGVHTAAPVLDLYSGLPFVKDTDNLVDRLSQQNVSPILVDAPNTVLDGYESYTDCFNDLRLRLSRHYQLNATKDGWQIWTKAPAMERHEN